jgi:carbonic anhydrase/acetyltransferase-like protein (isoleucine patch superfamily)
MSIRAVGPIFLADTARVMGEVTFGPRCSVWYGAAIRGDVAPITFGEMTNIQDSATVHCDSGVPNTIGSRVTIGHNAVVHGKHVGDGTLIGMHATVLGQTFIGSGCLVAAGCVVPPGLEVPDGMVVIGVPGKIVRPVNDKEREYLRWLPEHYAELAKRYADSPNDPRLRPYVTGSKPRHGPTTLA